MTMNDYVVPTVVDSYKVWDGGTGIWNYDLMHPETVPNLPPARNIPQMPRPSVVSYLAINGTAIIIQNGEVKNG